MHEGINVSLKSDILFYLWGFPISNSLLASFFLSILLIFLFFWTTKKFNLRPNKFQLIIESIVYFGYDFVRDALGDDKIAKKVYPLIASLFFVILFFNLAKFLPGMESLRFGEHHLFKPVHSDINMTLALGIVAWIVIQFLGIFVLGIWKYGKKFLQFHLVKGFIPVINPIGLLEIISEVAKAVSLSFRLFMNILVGGVLILLLEQVSHLGIPVIGMIFEVFVAILQAGIFALLTLFYIKLATDEPH